jgi:hypothetical protein
VWGKGRTVGRKSRTGGGRKSRTGGGRKSRTGGGGRRRIRIRGVRAAVGVV